MPHRGNHVFSYTKVSDCIIWIENSKDFVDIFIFTSTHSIERLFEPTIPAGKGFVTRELQPRLGTIQQTSQGTTYNWTKSPVCLSTRSTGGKRQLRNRVRRAH